MATTKAAVRSTILRCFVLIRTLGVQQSCEFDRQLEPHHGRLETRLDALAQDIWMLNYSRRIPRSLFQSRLQTQQRFQVTV